MKKIFSKFKDFLKSDNGYNLVFSIFVNMFFLMFVSALAVVIYNFGYEAGYSNSNVSFNDNILYIEEV